MPLDDNTFQCANCGATVIRTPTRKRFCNRACHYAYRAKPEMIEQRFWKYVRKTTSCWLWVGSLNTYGYGELGIPGGHWMAHRLSWTLANGTIPEGLWVLHNCPDGDNPACVRPDHLFLGTPADNTADMIAKGRQRFHTAQRRETCRNGHPKTGDNLIIKSGYAICRICKNAAQRAGFAKRDAASRTELNRKRNEYRHRIKIAK